MGAKSGLQREKLEKALVAAGVSSFTRLDDGGYLIDCSTPSCSKQFTWYEGEPINKICHCCQHKGTNYVVAGGQVVAFKDGQVPNTGFIMDDINDIVRG